MHFEAGEAGSRHPCTHMLAGALSRTARCRRPCGLPACRSVGVEVTPHKRTHRYRVVDNLSFPLYDPDWGVSELRHGPQGLLCATLGREVHGAVAVPGA
jgi:hypothetical protein